VWEKSPHVCGLWFYKMRGSRLAWERDRQEYCVRLGDDYTAEKVWASTPDLERAKRRAESLVGLLGDLNQDNH
jgi:hypothetical protein